MCWISWACWMSKRKNKKKLPIFRKFFLRGPRWVSNPRPSEPQTDALTNWATKSIKSDCKYRIKLGIAKSILENIRVSENYLWKMIDINFWHYWIRRWNLYCGRDSNEKPASREASGNIIFSMLIIADSGEDLQWIARLPPEKRLDELFKSVKGYTVEACCWICQKSSNCWFCEASNFGLS